MKFLKIRIFRLKEVRALEIPLVLEFCPNSPIKGLKEN
jgi:hypothetical protein